MSFMKKSLEIKSALKSTRKPLKDSIFTIFFWLKARDECIA